jgi:hypothetical protein
VRHFQSLLSNSLKKNRLAGRTVTEFNWGQYCLYAFWPRILVSVNGRFDTSYSRPVLDVNMDFMMGVRAGVIGHQKRGPFQADRVLKGKKRNLRFGPRDRLEGSVPAVSMYIESVPLFDNASRMPSVLQGIHCHTWIAFLVITFQLLTRQNIEDV